MHSEQHQGHGQNPSEAGIWRYEDLNNVRALRTCSTLVLLTENYAAIFSDKGVLHNRLRLLSPTGPKAEYWLEGCEFLCK